MTLKIPITRHTSLALSLALATCAQADQATVQPKASQSTIFADQISTLLAKRLPTAIKTVEQQKQEEQAVEALAKNIKYKPLQIPKVESNIDQVAHQIISNQSSKLERTGLTPAAYDKLKIASTKTTDDTGAIIYGKGLIDQLCINGSRLAKSVTAFQLSIPTTRQEEITESQTIIKHLIAEQTLQKILKKNITQEEAILPLFDATQNLVPKFITEREYWGGNNTWLSYINAQSFFTPLNRFPCLLETKMPIGIGFFLVHLAKFGGKYLVNDSKHVWIRLVYNSLFLNNPSIEADKDITASIKNIAKATPRFNLPIFSADKLVFINKVMYKDFTDTNHLRNRTEKYLRSTGQYTEANIKAILENPSLKPSIVEPILFNLVYGYIFYTSTMSAYNIEKHWKDVQAQFIGLATYLDQLRAVVKHFKKHNLKFNLAFPELKALANLDNKTNHSADFNQLIDLLKTGTFKSQASMLSYLGRVKCAYKLFMNVRAEFEPILYAMGKLQMYQGLANLFASSEEKENRFCFVEFSNEGPFIDARDCWNMLIGQDKAVSNSILITPDQKDIIVHGPNTGGKTSAILALIDGLITAQRFGIAPCSYLKFSPFSQFNCFFDIQDDITGGTSLFEAEVKFSTQLNKQVASLKEGEYAFTICDEIMRSTSPAEGQNCAYQFTNKMGKHAGSVCFTVTHYPKLLELRNLPGFRTFYVEVLRDADGHINRTFKFKEGITDINIAKDLLEKHGLFDKDDLHEMHARKMAAAGASR